MKIGVLALQGAFREHIAILRRLGVDAVEVRLPEDLSDMDGLILPGGESTTIGKLAAAYGLIDSLRRFAQNKPVWGTCAGMILMARKIDLDQPCLGFMNIAVQRNAFGRQVDSFVEDLRICIWKDSVRQPFPGIFIRAPKLIEVGEGVDVIARLGDGTAVAAQEGKWLATAFHPELTQDLRFHQYFIDIIIDNHK